MEEMRNAYRILAGKTKGTRLLGRSRRMWDDNIKVGLREIGCVDMAWIRLAQDWVQLEAPVNTVMNIRAP
jgi:hypothetical protein